MSTYSTLVTKREKMELVTKILNLIEQGGGRFLREGSGSSYWHSVKKRTAREKISHALRDHSNRLPFRNNSNATTSSESQQENATSSPCWRTLVYDTVQIQKGKSGKSAAATNDIHSLEPVDAHDHLDTKNQPLCTGSTARQQDAGVTNQSNTQVLLDTTRRNFLNAMMRSHHQGGSMMPMPHYLPASSLAQSAASLPRPDNEAIPGNIGSSALFASDARKQIELMGLSMRANSAVARRDTAHNHAKMSSISSSSQAFERPIHAPQKPRLVAGAARRHSLEPLDIGNHPGVPMPRNDDSNATAAFASDQFVGTNMDSFRRGSFGARNSTLDSFRRDSLESDGNRRDSLGAFFEPSFGNMQGHNDEQSFLTNATDSNHFAAQAFVGADMTEPSPDGFTSATSVEHNHGMAASNMVDLQHQYHQEDIEAQLIDPIPIHFSTSQSEAAFPPSAAYIEATGESFAAAHRHDEAAPAPQEQQEHEHPQTRRHERKNTDQHMDSLLLELFKK